MTVKICFFCKHCAYEEPIAYSSVTFDSGSVYCRKKFWSLDGFPLVDIGRELARAETCAEYEPAEGIPA